MNKGRPQAKFFSFLEKLPVAHALARACECQAFSHFQFKPPILDLGCGGGLFAQICFGQGKIDVGLDKDQRAIGVAIKKGVYQKAVVGDAISLPLPEKSFNTVISNSTLEHIREIDQVLSEVNRVLKKGGQFVFTVPTPQIGDYLLFSQIFARVGLKSLARAYARLKNKIWSHIHLESQSWWKAKLKKAGFDRVESFSFAPRKVVAICDFLAPFSLPSYLIKARTGYWWVWRPKSMTKILYYFLNKLYLGKTKEGVTFIFQAIKQ